MSFRGIAEFVLHIEHFRNIDLFQQGLYFLKFQIFNEDPEKIYYANPYDHISKDYESRAKNKANYHRLQEPQIYDSQASFVTKTFFIRYAEENVTIRDIVKFRTEIDVQPGYLQTEFFLRCDLFYSPPPQANFQASINSAEIMKEEVNKSSTKFKNVQTKIFQINNLLHGYSSFIPITFEREYTCFAICTLHGSLIDFRFRNKNARMTQDDSICDTFMENGILVERKFIEDPNENQQEQKKIQKWVPQNITEYFFFDEFGYLSITDKKIFEQYGEYTETIRYVYENIQKLYQRISSKILTEEDIKNENLIRIPKDVELKGLDFYLDNDLKGRLLSPNPKKIKKAQKISSQAEAIVQESEQEEQSTAACSKYILDNVERFESPGSQCDGISDEEESKIEPAIPLIKTNTKEGRQQRINGIIIPNSLTIQQFKDNESAFLIETNKFETNDPSKIANAIIMEINYLAGQVFELSNSLAKLIIHKPKKVFKILSEEYQRRLEEKYGENILRHVIQTSDFSFPSEDYTGQLNDVIARKTRETLQRHQELMGSDLLPIEEVKIEEEPIAGKKSKKRKKRNMEKYAPLIFEECYIKHKGLNKIQNSFELQQDLQKINPNKVSSMYKGAHLFVMCHGFQGSSFDMRMFKNIISIALPEAQFLCSAANEDDTEGNIFDMGYRLAQEVHQFIRESCPGNNLARLTFVGHSLGGLIIRASLPYLEKFKDKMHGYLSLCSPHLGYMYKSSKIFNAGMWVLKKWRKSVCLSQLALTDSKELEKSALFELSKSEGFAWFKHLILVSSFQDQYAPFDSARIQICKDATKDIQKGNIYIQMAHNLLSQVPIDVLYRLDINFQIQETNLDSLIGRTAHILFLENEELMKMIVSRYKDFFS